MKKGTFTGFGLLTLLLVWGLAACGNDTGTALVLTSFETGTKSGNTFTPDNSFSKGENIRIETLIKGSCPGKDISHYVFTVKKGGTVIGDPYNKDVPTPPGYNQDGTFTHGIGYWESKELAVGTDYSVDVYAG